MAPGARKLDKSVHSKDQLAFRQLMIAARKVANLTQQDVADGLKRPQSFVAKYEGGERRIDVVEFVQICRVLEVDPTKIIKKLIASA